MVKREVTGIRPLGYSKWHRAHAPATCYCTDLDMIEWRDGRGIVAVMEVKDGNATFTGFQLKVLKELGFKLQCPAYMVRFYAGSLALDIEDKFLVEEFFPLRQTFHMTTQEYQKFLSTL